MNGTRLTWRVGCEDGPCPNIYDTNEKGMAAVQGTRLTDAAALATITVPDHETLVIVPRSLLRAYARAEVRRIVLAPIVAMGRALRPGKA
jgi:hypothetical protein